MGSRSTDSMDQDWRLYQGHRWPWPSRLFGADRRLAESAICSKARPHDANGNRRLGCGHGSLSRIRRASPLETDRAGYSISGTRPQRGILKPSSLFVPSSPDGRGRASERDRWGACRGTWLALRERIRAQWKAPLRMGSESAGVVVSRSRTQRSTGHRGEPFQSPSPGPRGGCR